MILACVVNTSVVPDLTSPGPARVICHSLPYRDLVTAWDIDANSTRPTGAVSSEVIHWNIYSARDDSARLFLNPCFIGFFLLVVFTSLVAISSTRTTAGSYYLVFIWIRYLEDPYFRLLVPSSQLSLAHLATACLALHWLPARLYSRFATYTAVSYSPSLTITSSPFSLNCLISSIRSRHTTELGPGMLVDLCHDLVLLAGCCWPS